MAGITPQLPLTRDAINGYTLITEYKNLVKQNFRNLMFTIPGERIMDPDFGVGVRTFLFEIDNEELHSNLTAKIIQQAGTYMPFVQIMDVAYKSQLNDINIDPNLLYIRITYIITPLDFVDKLDITIPNY